MKKQTMLMLGMIFLMAILPMTSASYGTFKQNSNVEIIQTCTDGTAMCDGCNITSIIYNPDSATIVRDVVMEKRLSDFNYTVYIEKIGTYTFNGICLTATEEELFRDTFDINGYGSEVTTSQTIGYLVTLLILLLVFLITCYGSYKIPFKNKRNEEDKIISINDLKYLKIVLIIFAYLEFFFMISIMRNISLGYLLNEGIYQFFNVLYWFMLCALIPMFPVLIFFTVVIWLSDQKIQKTIKRGIQT